MMLYSEQYYRECAEKEERKQKIIENVLYTIGTAAILVAVFCAWWFSPIFR